MDCVVIEWSRERFLDRRQQVRLERQRDELNYFLGLNPTLIVTPTSIQTEDWRTLNPDEDDLP